MESRAFIRTAAALIKKIEDAQEFRGSDEEVRAHHEGIQREITSTFSGLQNPSLPSAAKLRDAANWGAYLVAPGVHQKIQQAENFWYW